MSISDKAFTLALGMVNENRRINSQAPSPWDVEPGYARSPISLLGHAFGLLEGG